MPHQDALPAEAAKHTPGPWRIEYLGGWSAVITATKPQHLDRRIPAYAYDEKRGWSVGYPFLADGAAEARWDFVCYSHADARLITAAPELLALARRVADHFGTAGALGRDALALIAKATA